MVPQNRPPVTWQVSGTQPFGTQTPPVQVSPLAQPPQSRLLPQPLPTVPQNLVVPA